MSGQQMTNPELNSVHSVKILLCYILDRLNRPVTEEQLQVISEDSGAINYFYYSDALEELIENGSVSAEGSFPRTIAVTEKGRLGSEYFNHYIPLVFRKKLLRAAFGFFIKEQNKGICRCDISEGENGCTVGFKLTDNGLTLIDMSFYAPDRAQAELISGRIKANPAGAYRSILTFLLENEEEDIDVTDYL